MTELIRFTVSGSPAELSAHMPLVVVLVPQVMALRPRFAATVKVMMSRLPRKRRWIFDALVPILLSLESVEVLNG